MLTALKERVQDWVLKHEARNIFLTGTVVVAGLISFLSWGPLTWFLLSFIPDGAAGGWIVALLITIGVGWFGGILIPFIVIVLGVMAWVSNP